MFGIGTGVEKEKIKTRKGRENLELPKQNLVKKEMAHDFSTGNWGRCLTFSLKSIYSVTII